MDPGGLQQQINVGLQCMDNLVLWIRGLICFNILLELMSLRPEVGALLGVGASLWQLPSFSTLRQSMSPQLLLAALSSHRFSPKHPRKRLGYRFHDLKAVLPVDKPDGGFDAGLKLAEGASIVLAMALRTKRYLLQCPVNNL